MGLRSVYAEHSVTNGYGLCPCMKSAYYSLAGVAQGFEHRPVNPKVAGSIPSQGTCLGHRPGPSWGCMTGNQCVSHICFSPSLCPSLPLSLQINKIFLKCILKLTNHCVSLT